MMISVALSSQADQFGGMGQSRVPDFSRYLFPVGWAVPVPLIEGHLLALWLRTLRRCWRDDGNCCVRKFAGRNVLPFFGIANPHNQSLTDRTLTLPRALRACWRLQFVVLSHKLFFIPAALSSS